MTRSALLALVLLAACGPADTGSRHDGPDALVNEWAVYWWDGTNATTRLWLLETVQEHDLLLRRHLNGEPIPRTRIHFYPTQQDWQAAFSTARQLYRPKPVALSSAHLSAVIGWAFIVPFDRSLHVWAGPKLEAHQLGHAMLHAVIGEDWPTCAAHFDPRWQSFLSRQTILSTTIASRR
jgi:hypothetical protein